MLGMRKNCQGWEEEVFFLPPDLDVEPMEIAERKRQTPINTYKGGRTRQGGGLRTLGSDGVDWVLGAWMRVGRIVDAGRVGGVEIGRADRVLCCRGWMLWRGGVAEAGGNLFMQVLQVHIVF